MKDIQYIAHRINTREELIRLPKQYGVELDLRDRGERLILQHDPFSDGEDFEPYLAAYEHGLLILNIKSERIEYKVQELIRKYNVTEYFFLDSSFPMIFTLSLQGEQNIALRFSEFESMESILKMQGKVNWVWVDSFQKLVFDRKIYNILQSAGFRFCLVSPELQGREEDIKLYKKYFLSEGIFFDAICTKQHNIPFWQSQEV